MSKEKSKASRRDFLKLASAAAPASAVVMSGAAPAKADPLDPEVKPKGLRKTAHVKRYLELARF